MKSSLLELNRTEIEEILHHAHWIAANNGAQALFIKEKYPAFRFDQLMKILIDAKCLVRSQSGNGELTHFSGWRVRKGLKNIAIPMQP